MMLRRSSQLIRCIYQSQLRWSFSTRCWSSRRPKLLPRKRWNSGAFVVGSAIRSDSTTLIKSSSWTLHITRRVRNWTHTTRRVRIETCCSIANMMYCNVSCNHWVIEDYLWSGKSLTTSLGVTIVPSIVIGGTIAGKSRQLDGYTVSYYPCTYCGKNHSPSVCLKRIRKGSGSTRHHIRSARSSFCRLKDFPTLPMYRDTAGNAVTYEATSKSGQKRVFFPALRYAIVGLPPYLRPFWPSVLASSLGR